MGQRATGGLGRGAGPGRWSGGAGVVRAARGALALVSLIAGLGPAHAATDTIVSIRGNVVPACTITGLATSLALGNLTASGSATLNFTATCNAPFSYSLDSAFGGLRHSSGATTPSGFSALFPYTVRAILPTDAGSIDNTCTSASISNGATTCLFSDSGTGIAINSAAQLQLGWTGVPNLLGGNYSDTLTLTIGIRP